MWFVLRCMNSAVVLFVIILVVLFAIPCAGAMELAELMHRDESA